MDNRGNHAVPSTGGAECVSTRASAPAFRSTAYQAPEVSHVRGEKSSLSLPFAKSGDIADIEAIKQHVAWIEFSPAGEILSANAQFLQVTGYQLHEIQDSITGFSAALLTASHPTITPSGKRWPPANR